MADRSTIQAFKKLIEPVKRFAMLSIARLVIKAIDDSTGLQVVKGLAFSDMTKDGMERMQNYGFTCVPKAGSEAVVVFPGGNQDHGIVIAIDDRRYRIKSLAEGEVAMYTDEGDKIHFKRGHIIDVQTHTFNLTASTAVNIDTASFNVSASSSSNFDTPMVAASGQVAAEGNMASGGSLAVTGNITLLAGAVSVEEFKIKYNTHTHEENGDGGGTTDPTDGTYQI